MSITASGRIVQVERARVSDTGRYTCVATNVAGEDEKDFDVNVQGERGQPVCWWGWSHAASFGSSETFSDIFSPSFSLVPPSFNRAGGAADSTSAGVEGDVRDVVLSNPISLYCDSNAVPPPTLTWYKDGQLLASSDKVLILPGN